MLKLRNWNGTVHYTTDGTSVACGHIQTHNSWLNQTLTQVTCERCIARYGEDHNHSEDPKDEYTLNIERRAAERAARQAARAAL